MTEPNDNTTAAQSAAGQTSRRAETWRAAGFAASAAAAMIAMVVLTVLVLDRPGVRGKDFLITPGLEQLKSQFAKNPKDKELAERIRQMDLDRREQYFSYVSVARYGNWLLLGCLVLFVASVRSAIALRPRRPDIGPKHPDFRGELRRATGRRTAVAALAAVLIAGALTPAAIEAYIRATTVPPPPPHVADQALAAKYWPQFRGPGSQGIGVHDNVPTTWDAPAGVNVLWRAPVPEPGKSSPVVWGKKVFLTAGNKDVREVLCYNADTGGLLWSAPVKDIPGSPAQMTAPYEETGWAAPSPVVDDQHVAAIFPNGDLACFDHDGKLAWAKALGAPVNQYSHSSSLAIFRNLVIVLWDQGAIEDYMSRILAFDINTGRVVWQQRRPVSASWATPSIVELHGMWQLLTSSNPWLISYDPVTGAELWRAKTLEGGEVASTPVGAGHIAYSICAETQLTAVDASGTGDVTKSKKLWENGKGRTDLTSPVTDGKLLWTIETGGKLTCFDAKTGTVVYQQDIEGSFNASPSLCAGKLWLLDLKGKMYVCDAGREFKLLATNPLGEGTYASPAFQDGRIYIRGKSNLYCIAAGAKARPSTAPAADGDHASQDGEDE